MGSLFKQFFNICTTYPNNNALVFYKTTNHYEKYTYEQILKLCGAIQEILKKFVASSTCFGVFVEHNPLLLPVLLGIHKFDSAFLCLNEAESWESIKNISRSANIKYFISTNSKMFTDMIMITEVNLEQNIFKLWALPDVPIKRNRCNSNIAYLVRTSGSTNDAKLVFVTHQCINPNIQDFRDKFKITCSDIIYLGTPTTFDPFVVELYLSLTSGASCLMVSKHLKHSPELTQILFKLNPISYLQITPSLFRLWDIESITQCILSKKSRLRILAFGGEVCPTMEELRKWKHLENETRIFYLYGITEVSCWAMIREVEMHEINNLAEGIYLGEMMSDTTFNIKNQNEDTTLGELYIGSSSRISIMEGENISDILASNHIILRATGDLVKIYDGRLYYLSRLNDCIKRYGTKVNLCSIENKINNLESIEKSCCVWFTEMEQLVLFYKATKTISEHNLWIFIQAHLTVSEYPDFIHPINFFPLSDHGKISKYKLKLIHQDEIKKKSLSNNCIEQYFLQELRTLLPNIQEEFSFLQLGGTSITALIITNKLEMIANTTFKNLISMLLNYDISIHDCIMYIKEIVCMSKGQNFCDKYATVNQKFKIKILWTHNLDKCIDATPTLLQNTYVTVGSHSHIVITLEKNTGAVISLLTLPDRVEAPVTYISNNSAVVGCYDGFLYCFNYNKGEISWTFKTGDMIKGKAVHLEEMSMLIFPSYDKNLYNINSTNGQLIWFIQICSKPLLATPCVSTFKKSVLCCSLGGTCAYLDLINGDIKWSRIYNNPIFSSPIIINENSSTEWYMLSEVDGTLHCLDEDGLELWKFSATGNIFSSFIEFKKDKQLIMFGSHDKNIYCLEYMQKAQVPAPILKWKCRLKSQVYATPNIITLRNEEYLLGASTNGHICVIDIETGIIISDMYIEGEIYSSPVVCGDVFYFGCRDNNLYCARVV